MSDLKDEQSSSDSSEPLLHRRTDLWPVRQGNLQTESDPELTGFLPTTRAVHDRTSNTSTKMHSESPPRLNLNLHPSASQPYIHNPKAATPLDGAPEFPPNPKPLIREFCGGENTRRLPCARALSSKPSRSGASFRYEDAVTGIVLVASTYKYEPDKILTVVHGRREPAIVNYMNGADGETNSRKLYSVWNGILRSSTSSVR
jgi:hypothetical protein